MPSTYTTRLRLTLPATGELTNTWGTTVNTGITELVDASIAGAATLSTWGGAGVAYTLSNNNGVTDEARCMFIVASGSPGEAKNIICPAVSKLYVVKNEVTGGFSVTLKTAAGTGITVENGKTAILRCDGTNVVNAITQLPSFVVAGGTPNQVQFLNASRELTGSANMTFDGTTLSVAALADASLTSGRVTYATTSGNLTDSANLTFDGTALTLGGNPTLSAGTANGMLYLNGSKVATSGSALTFDGTTFSVLGPITLSNNLGFISTVQRVTGDMSSATIANRLAFQTSITNGNTSLMAIPNGTSTTSQVLVTNNSDPTNSSFGSIFASSSEVRVQSARLGTGTFLPLAFYTNSVEQARIDTSGNFLIGTTSDGAAGLGISNLLNLTFPEGSGTSYTNLFRQASSGATVIANGYKRSATASGFASSIGTSWAKTAIGLGVGTGAITFYTDSAGTVANGTDVTPSERARITSAGDFIHQVNGTAPSLSTNSTMSFELTSNTSLKIVVRGTDGVTRSTTLTLT